MFNFSIMGLQEAHLNEIVADIAEQYNTGVSDMALFCMTLVPEGDPPADKAASLCKKFDLFRDALAEKNARCGVLVQASIGHGYVLNRMFPFRRYVNLSDGREENVVCPYDESFRRFFRGQLRTVAAHRPAHIMLDDDFRLLGRGGMGCACAVHMAEFNRRAGTDFTREQLWALLKDDAPESKRYADIFIETQRDSLLGAVREYRAGIDEINPTIPGSYCCVLGEFEQEIAAVMAGKGNPVIVRINNGNYTAPGPRNFSRFMLKAAYQMQCAAGPVDAFLAETDTCPQNRYSTSARLLHAHFTGTLLEGAAGAKQWITRLSAFEPESGRAYRNILSRNAGFYRAVSDLAPRLRPFGCRIPLPQKWAYSFRTGAEVYGTGFACNVLERLGLPLYFSNKPGGAVFLDRNAEQAFSDAELREMLAGTVVMDGQTAHRLERRGLSALTGVSVKDWTGPRVSGELLPNGNACNPQVRPRELVPLNSNVKADSLCYHMPDGVSTEPLFPGVTVYKNELGGTAIVFCGDPNGAFNIIEAFSMLTESRKAQLIGLLQSTGNLPLYSPGDEEVYLRGAEMTDRNARFACLFNLGLDTIEGVTLINDRPVSSVSALQPDGQFAPVAFSCLQQQKNSYKLTLQRNAETLNPVALILK